MNKKSLILFLGFTSLAFGQVKKNVSYFPLNKVHLLESVFSKAMQTDEKYILSMDADRLLAPYLKEAGLKPKKKIIPIGKIQDWMVTSAAIIFQHWL